MVKDVKDLVRLSNEQCLVIAFELMVYIAESPQITKKMDKVYLLMLAMDLEIEILNRTNLKEKKGLVKKASENFNNSLFFRLVFGVFRIESAVLTQRLFELLDILSFYSIE